MNRTGGTFLTDRAARTSYAAATLSLSAALIHLFAAPEHFEEWWGYGTFFVGSAVVQGAYAVVLLRGPWGSSFYTVGIAGNLVIVVLWLVTRTAGIPFLGPHAWEVEGVGALDLSATAAEVALVVALVALRRGRGLSKEGWFMVFLLVVYAALAFALFGRLTRFGDH